MKRLSTLLFFVCLFARSAFATDTVLHLEQSANGDEFVVLANQQVAVSLKSDAAAGSHWTVIDNGGLGKPVETDQPGLQVFTWKIDPPDAHQKHKVKLAAGRQSVVFTLRVLPVNYDCGGAAFDPNCPIAKTEESCKAHGGQWLQVGLNLDKTCVCATPDAGCSCKNANDCAGLCVGTGSLDSCSLEGATCGPMLPQADCLCKVGDDGRVNAVCID